MKNKTAVWIIDLGSQYSQLITRKTRELCFSAELMSYPLFVEKWNQGERPKCLVLSGGPQSIFEDQEDYSLLKGEEISKLPILAICYGMQLLVWLENKSLVTRGNRGEYGATLVIDLKTANCFKVWMSHFDQVLSCPENYLPLYETENKILAGIIHKRYKWLALQFHPEVSHTERGKEILSHFYLEIANLSHDWDSKNILQFSVDRFNEENNLSAVSGDEILCAFSGGVDSLVAATLMKEKMGKSPHCFFIDNGLVRPQDYLQIEKLKKETGLMINVINAKEKFYLALKGKIDPEEKRKIIGHTFIAVFEEVVKEYQKERKIHFKYLLQGTLYPDIIESGGPQRQGNLSHKIKSHHNVGGLPERMQLSLLEPLKWLFKDEVRKIGQELNLDKEDLYRHPFPGPGLGVRILGEVSEERCFILKQADEILFQELKRKNFYNQTWQAAVILLPVKTVGVKGDARVYEEVLVLRLVDSEDGMTANFTELPFSFFREVASKMTSEIRGITRVVYDITSKPPATIEWE